MGEHVTVRQLRHATQQCQEWLKDLSGRGPLETEEQGYTFLRAVLHAVRDRLTVEEAAHFGQQLPMLVRGFYYEGWRPAMAPNDFDTEEEFLSRIEESLHTPPMGEEIDVGAGTRAVLQFLEENVDPGELRHVKGQLPAKIAELFPTPEPSAAGD